jgi:hypothetical protein
LRKKRFYSYQEARNQDNDNNDTDISEVEE